MADPATPVPALATPLDEKNRKSGEDNPTLAETLQKRLSYLEAKRLQWEDHWDEVFEYVVPWREYFPDRGDMSKKVGINVYDGTPISALRLLADGMQGYLVSEGIRWFKLMMVNRRLEEYKEVRQWLQEVEEYLYAAFKRSNFYDSMVEVFLDGGSIGNSTLLVEEDPVDGIYFRCEHPKTVYIANDHRGRVVETYRKMKMTAKQAVEYFGELYLEDEVKDAVKDGDPYKEYTFCNAVMRNVEELEGSRMKWNMPWVSYWWQDKKLKILRQDGYWGNPLINWRWRKASNEWYGRGPGSDALVDVRAVNKITKTNLKIGELAINPPLEIPEERDEADVRIKARGMNFYEDPNRRIFPIEYGKGYQISIDILERMQDVIEDHFRVKFWLMLAQSERQMTATEIIEKQGEKAAILGPTIGRLNSELLDPVIDLVFDIEMYAGRLPPPPEILRQFGAKIEVDYLGPLAQAQKRLFQTHGILRGLEVTGPIIMNMFPESADVIDGDEIVRELLTSFGVPESALRTKELVAQIREARQKQEQTAIALEEAQAGASAMKDLNVPVEENSLLEQVQEVGAEAGLSATG